MRKWMVFAVAVMALSGCPGPARTDGEHQEQQKALEAKGAEAPAVWKLVDSIITLAKGGIDELYKFAQKLNRRQELQETVRAWLIAAAIGFGLFALVAVAGKILGRGASAAAWWAAPLVWVAEQVPWPAVILAGVVCAACICAAVWIAPLWRIGIDLLHLIGYVITFATGYTLAGRLHTGAWKADGFVRLPKSWRVAPDDLEAKLPAGWKLMKG